MKIKKIMLAGLIMIAMNLSLIACGKEEKEASRGTSEQRTESTKQTEEGESGEETGSGEESASEEESSSEEATDRETGSESSEESSEASTEFAVPIQEDFTPVEGLSDKYVDFENRSFAYNGKVFKLGESTLKDLIDGGIPFDESDLNNKGNNVNKNYETSRYTADINKYVTMQFKFVNITGDTLTEEECLLSYVRINYLYVPQPDYDAERNATITENILDAANTVCFSFPATLTKEQLLENSSEGAEQDDYNNVDYRIKSEVYMGSSGYHFRFNDTTNQMKEMTMDWLP
ncbi:MAG: hypothetical protein K2K63_04060 [Acetatifactor sp.]|nr:hypothetical protein [Acetatifactor sp.]